MDHTGSAPKIDCIVLMGVSGSGKTTIGEALAAKLNWPFFDADNFHPAENHRKMAAGIPLNDQDRAPWLKILSDLIASHAAQGQSILLACSALKRAYREILRDSLEVQFVYLHGSKELIAKRLQTRKGHFMNPALLDSQFETLEEPHLALQVEITDSPNLIVQQVCEGLGIS